MIFTSGIVSVIIQKNKLCKNKIRAIYFCPNCVKFLPENVNVFFFFLQTLTKTKQKCKKIWQFSYLILRDIMEKEKCFINN